MKPHVIIKLREELVDDDHVPHWVRFISDKSAARTRVRPDIDRVLLSSGRRFWLTREYLPANRRPTVDERATGLNRTYRLVCQEDGPLSPDLIQHLAQQSSVESARPIKVGAATLPSHATSDSERSLEQARGRTSAAEMIGLPFARALSRGSPEVSVAILDTGADLQHPELTQKISKRADFVQLDGLDTTDFIGDVTGYDDVPEDEVGHGTHVSGIVAGRGLRMDEGVAPDCGLMAVRVLATMKHGDRRVGAGIVDNINAGIKWAVDNGADVINMSLGIKHTGGGLPHEDVIQYALRKNVSVVAASGNDGTAERYYPGALQGVFAVGAVDDVGAVAGFSSYGANIYVVAPGTRIFSSFARGGYAVASGTSQAAPFVSGSVALFKSYASQRGTKLTNRDIGYVLKNTSDKIDSRLRNPQAGYGVLNLVDGFKLLNQMLS